MKEEKIITLLDRKNSEGKYEDRALVVTNKKPVAVYFNKYQVFAARLASSAPGRAPEFWIVTDDGKRFVKCANEKKYFLLQSEAPEAVWSEAFARLDGKI